MAGLGQTEYTGVAQEARMTLSPRRRLSILAAPLFGGVSLVLAQAHAFGTGEQQRLRDPSARRHFRKGRD